MSGINLCVSFGSTLASFICADLNAFCNVCHYLCSQSNVLLPHGCHGVSVMQLAYLSNY